MQVLIQVMHFGYGQPYSIQYRLELYGLFP